MRSNTSLVSLLAATVKKVIIGAGNSRKWAFDGSVVM